MVLLITQKFSFCFPRFFVFFLRVLLFLLCNIFFIPAVNMASLALKYSSVSSEYIQEYSSIPSSNLNFGLIGQGLSLFGLGILILLTVFYEACSYEIRHSMLELKSDSRASHKACVIVKAANLVTIWINLALQYQNYQEYLIIAFAIHGFSAYTMLYNLPYYAFYLNFIKVFVQVDYCCIIAFIWLALKLNNPAVCLLLTIFMQIPIVIVVYQLLLYRITKIYSIENSVYCEQEIFGLSARKYLASGELKEKILNFFHKNTKFSKSP